MMFSLPKPVNNYKVYNDESREPKEAETALQLKDPVSSALAKVGTGATGGTGRTLSTTVNENGQVDFSACVKKGDTIVYSSLTDMKEHQGQKGISIEEPSEEEKQRDLDETKAALDAIVNLKVNATKSANFSNHSLATSKNGAQFIKYTGGQGVGVTKQRERVIRMVEAPVDPLEPPRFRHQKVPRGPDNDPVPVLQDAPKKLTVEEQREWKIPPCVSNWKNAKGYTVPLDKRLAADGRGLSDVQINDKFAKLTESMYIAENEARKEVSERNRIKAEIAQQERKNQEEKLRELASIARKQKAEVLYGGHVPKEEPQLQSTTGSRGDDRTGRGAVKRERTHSHPRPSRARRSKSRSISLSSSGSSSSSSSDTITGRQGQKAKQTVQRRSRKNQEHRSRSRPRAHGRSYSMSRRRGRRSRSSSRSRGRHSSKRRHREQRKSRRSYSAEESVERRSSRRHRRRDESVSSLGRHSSRKSSRRRHHGDSDRRRRRSRSRQRSESQDEKERRRRKRRKTMKEDKEREALKERERIRIERKKERERDYKLERAGIKTKMRLKSDKDRDISELVALGKTVPRQTAGESLFDARLFNQDQGMDAGFGNDGDYRLYDKPLFNSVSSKIYRPKKHEEDKLGTAEDQLKMLKKRGDKFESEETTYKLKPSRDFAGVDRSKPSEGRTGPVQFETA